MIDKYILEGKKPKLVTGLYEWGRWYEKADRTVANTDLPNGTQVSTVFLGLDHSSGGGIPILFGTTIFGGEHDQETKRYATWEEAEAGHHRAVELASGKKETE